MESQYFGHKHPMVFNEEHSTQTEAAYCSRCGEVISGPSFSCMDCGFYLHKECAEAPSEINHPFHRDHPLCLLSNPPASATYEGGFICNFCGETGEMFVYHCSCNIDFHIKCALLTQNIAKKTLGELEGITYKDPLNSTENINNKELESSNKCFGCWEPLFDSAYYSFDRGLNLHKKCAELSFEINYPRHYEHPLILQFNVEKLPCIICHDTDRFGLCYCCPLCNFAIHIGTTCLSPPSIIEDKSHDHPFNLFFRQMPFTCDACGVEGNSVPYMCLTCNLLVHKKCISLPPIIKFVRHEHPIFHTYSLKRHESRSTNWDCVICLDEVNTKYGSYCCSECHFIVHVNCATKRKRWYYIIESVEKYNDKLALFSDVSMDSYTVIERNEGGEATKIKHFSHQHELILSNKILEDDEYCDGCTLFISDSFYYCSECNFFLHKICAEFPKKKHLWIHLCQQPLILTAGYIFRCSNCYLICNGFAYECHECRKRVCIRCVIPYTLTCEGHGHPLYFYVDYEGQCNACGNTTGKAYKCKKCKFALELECLVLPRTVRHKCDKHLLTLTYHDDNTYSEHHFCDVCEEDRNPNYWFYCCAICDKSAHPECVLGRNPFIKLGKIYKGSVHRHPVRLVKKMYDYPKCFECDDRCHELALECVESGCEYIVHLDCVQLLKLLGLFVALPENDGTNV